MKISRKDLRQLVENYTQSAQLNEFAFLDKVNPVKYVEKLETTIRTIATNKDRNYDPGPDIDKLVKLGGGANLLVFMFTSIVNTTPGLIINLAKNEYRSAAKKVAENNGYTFKEWSKFNPPFELWKMKKIIAHCKKRGYLKNKTLKEVTPGLVKVIKGLNPYSARKPWLHYVYGWSDKPMELMQIRRDEIDRVKFPEKYEDDVPVEKSKELEKLSKKNQAQQSTANQKISSNLSDEEDFFTFGQEDMSNVPPLLRRPDGVSTDLGSTDTDEPKNAEDEEATEFDVKKVYTIPGDKSWEYKKINGNWHTRKQGSVKFQSLANNSTAIEKLNKYQKEKRFKMVKENLNKNTLLRRRYRLRY